MNTTLRRRGLAAVAVLVTTIGVLAPLGAAASPAGYVVEERHADGVTADALPTTQIDGVAWDQKVAGNTVYVGGEFATARPAGAAPGTSLTPRANLLAYDVTTGKLIDSFRADTNATVNVVALSPDKSRLYVGGSFTTVQGRTRYRIAAIDTATGRLITSWAPSLDSSVHSIVVTDTAVYVGGVFSRANGVARTNLAAFDPVSGATLDWAPTANAQVRAMVATPDGKRIVIGGLFDEVNGATATGTASLDATTGAMYPFGVNQVIHNGSSNTGVYSLQTDGRKIVGTAFVYASSGYEGVFMADPYTGELTWLADCHGDSYDATPMGTQVYAVDHHHDCRNIGGYATRTGVYRRADAFDYNATGAVRPNAEDPYDDYAGNPATSIEAWSPDLAPGTYTGQTQAAWTAENNGRYLVLGGEFPRVNGSNQQGLVRFAVPGIAPVKQAPMGGGTGMELTATPNAAGTGVALSFKSVHDRDNMHFTYTVMRNDLTTPVATLQDDSMWWVRPTLSATDSTAQPGATHTYTVVAHDPDGNTVASSPVTVTMPAPNPGGMPTGTPTDTPTTSPTGTPTTPAVTKYVSAVRAGDPLHWWRLGDSTALLADQVGGNPMDSWNAAHGVGGAIAGDAAIAFNGTSANNGSAASARSMSTVGTVSQELWFKTTTTTGGVMMDLGTSRIGPSNRSDLDIHLTNDGRVVFNVGTSPANLAARASIRSGTGYNDGAWHHVVTSVGPAGAQLYVDGKLVGTHASVTRSALGSGFWRIGGDSAARLGNSSSSYFNGSIDEVAVYGAQLDATAVRNHAVAGGLVVG